MATRATPSDVDIGGLDTPGVGTTELGAAEVDGRTARAQRTRDGVVAAMLDLIDEGDPRPTARRIAERAGVSLRSVYVHFDDLEGLFLVAAAQQWQRIVTLVEPLPFDTPPEERLTAFVEQRARVLEVSGPVRRAAELQEHSSPALARVLGQARHLAREQVATVFEPELKTRRGVGRRRLLDALDATSGSAVWQVLRVHLGRDFGEAVAVMRTSMAALLTAREDDR